MNIVASVLDAWKHKRFIIQLVKQPQPLESIVAAFQMPYVGKQKRPVPIIGNMLMKIDLQNMAAGRLNVLKPVKYISQFNKRQQS